MINYKQNFESYIKTIKKEGRYRDLIPIKRDINNPPYGYYGESEEQIIIWCNNDYMCMGQNMNIINQAHKSLSVNGLGTGGTRNLSGNSYSIMELEKEVADLHNKESALVFTSGYVANDASISSLAKILPNIAFFSDQYNHASIISGISNSRAEKYIYNHLDPNHLEYLLKSVDIAKPKMIIFESIYSMSGTISPIKEICTLAQKYNALTLIDEVHSVGLYGNRGAGIANMLGFEDQIDIVQGTFGKAYGVIGGYITANTRVVDAIRLAARGFIFTTALPTVITDSATESVKFLKMQDATRLIHRKKVLETKTYLQAEGIPFFQNDTHIIPIILGDPNLTRKVSEILLKKHNIFLQHINFPTVSKGRERLRITPTQKHSTKMITHLVSSLSEVFKSLNIDYRYLSMLNECSDDITEKIFG